MKKILENKLKLINQIQAKKNQKIRKSKKSHLLYHKKVSQQHEQNTHSKIAQKTRK